MEKEYGRREDLLKREIADLQQVSALSKIGYNTLSTNLLILK